MVSFGLEWSKRGGDGARGLFLKVTEFDEFLLIEGVVLLALILFKYVFGGTLGSSGMFNSADNKLSLF